VDAEMFVPSGEPQKDGPLRLVYHGGAIAVSRGLDRLVQSLDRVRDLDVRLTLISSNREREVIEWIDKLGLHDRVDLIDTVPHAEVPSWVQRCDVGILPFPRCDIWNTSSPIKLFEYMACGKPVIATAIPAHENVLDGKPFAFLTDGSSPDSLAKGIRRAWAARADFRSLGEQARSQVLEHHTWERQAQVLTAFLQELGGASA